MKRVEPHLYCVYVMAPESGHPVKIGRTAGRAVERLKELKYL
jgi:hypothetical protein